MIYTYVNQAIKTVTSPLDDL